MAEKLVRLQQMLRQMGSGLVAYSGGVDSTLLLKIAYDVLGDRAIGVTADSPSQPRTELRDAQQIAAHIGVKHILLPMTEMSDPLYLANTPDRCYVCKRHICATLTAYAREHGYRYILDGSNVDDLSDLRPGRRAAAEFGLRSPLQETGFTKADIRTLSQQMGLPNWDKPSAACLSSRIPYGNLITLEALAQVERGESFLHSLGFRQVRVRHHGEIARLEFEVPDLERAFEQRSTIVAALKEIGFAYVTLDLSGFRSGSMNETLKK